MGMVLPVCLSRATMELLHKLGEKAAEPGGVSWASFVAGALRELRVGLYSANFFMHCARLVGRASGPGWMCPRMKLLCSLHVVFASISQALVHIYVLCCPVCLFPLCMALPHATDRDLLRQRVVALNALGCCVCFVTYNIEAEGVHM
jgi:hypothetical protein